MPGDSAAAGRGCAVPGQRSPAVLQGGGGRPARPIRIQPRGYLWGGGCIRPLTPPSLRPSAGAGKGGAEPSGRVAGGDRPRVGEGARGGAGPAGLTGKRWSRAPPPPPPHNCFRSPVPICPSPPVCVLAFVSLPCTDTLFQRPLLSPFTDRFCPINPSARGSEAPATKPRNGTGARASPLCAADPAAAARAARPGGPTGRDGIGLEDKQRQPSCPSRFGPK